MAEFFFVTKDKEGVRWIRWSVIVPTIGHYYDLWSSAFSEKNMFPPGPQSEESELICALFDEETNRTLGALKVLSDDVSAFEYFCERMVDTILESTKM